MTRQQIEHMIGFAKNAGYNYQAKTQFEKLSLKLLREVRTILGGRNNNDIRVSFNPGGIAVSGEATLHSTSVYIQIAGGFSFTCLVRAVTSKIETREPMRQVSRMLESERKECFVPHPLREVNMDKQVISRAPEVIADSSGKFCGNALRFATKEEAESNVHDLMMRWFAVRETRVVGVDGSGKLPVCGP